MITSRIDKASSRLTLALSLLTLFPLAPCPLAAAQELAWDYTFVESQTSAVTPVEIVATPDGGTVAAAFVRDFPLSDGDLPVRVVLSRFDENGDRLWNEIFATGGGYVASLLGDRYVDVDVDAQGGVFLLTSFNSAFELRRFAPDGTLVWNVPILGGVGAPEFRPMYMALHPNGSIIVAGSHSVQTFPRIDVRALDATGAELWRWNGDGAMGAANPATGIARGVSILTGGEIVVHGQSDDPNWNAAPRLYFLSANGAARGQHNISCTWYYHGDVVAAAPDSNGGLVVAANTVASFGSGVNLAIARFGANASENWCTGSSWSTLDYMRGKDVVVDDQGRVFLAGTVWNGSHGEARIFRLDAAGLFQGFVTPSGVDPLERSFGSTLAIVDGDVLLTASAEDGPDHTVVARFAPDGTERWSTRLPGHPSVDATPDAVTDDRGNPLVLSRVLVGGVHPNARWAMEVTKLVEGSPVGTSYCGPAVPNSTGVPATLRALGSDVVATDNVTLRADDLPAGTFVLLLASRTRGSAPGVGGGQGTLCLGGAIGRYVAPGQIRRSRNDGSAALQLDLATLPQPTGLVQGLAGETWNFQGWYRDLNPALTSNLTDGVSVVLQ